MNRKDDSVSRILKVAHLEPELAAQLDKYRRNITVMFTDIKGSTAYYERFGDSAGTLMVHRCNGLLGEIAERHGGRVIKTIGDSIMASFEDNGQAVAAAIEMQRIITAEQAAKPETHRISIRIGLNYGLGIVKKDDVYGDVVNTASRVETNAAPEQILVSDTIHQALAESGRFVFQYLGKFELKGKAETRDLFEVAWREQPSTMVTAAHSLVAPNPQVASTLRFKLQQVRKDGSPGIVHSLQPGPAVIGRNQGNLTFPHDNKMQSRHARVLIQEGQLFVEPIDGSSVFFSLIGPYRLQEGDVVRMGQQSFQFRVNATALASAAASGLHIRDLAELLDTAPAEFASTGPDQGHYLLREEEVTWGRIKGTYTFPDDLSMSRSHAKVFHRGEDFFLEDTGSRNGTFVKVREKTHLPVGVTLLIGGQLLRVAQTSAE